MFSVAVATKRVSYLIELPYFTQVALFYAYTAMTNVQNMSAKLT